jgi:AcrR family transcriptional regulator
MRHDDEVSAALLRAATDLLTVEGPRALTVRAIASAAGCSTMSLYSRFGGKDGVVEALFVEGFDQLRSAMEGEPTTDQPLIDLLACGRTYREFALGHPTYYAVMFDRVVPDYEPSDGARLHAASTLDALATRVQRALDAGLIAPRAAIDVAITLWGTCHGLVSLELKDAAPDEVAWAERYDDTLMVLVTGLRHAEPPSPDRGR